jgi:hypothetical protein
LSNRLWQAGGLVAALVLTLVVVNQFLPAHKAVGQDMLGHDFLAFYTAGTLAREGAWTDLYNLEHARTFQHDVGRSFDLDLGPSFGPYWNPPIYAWLFAPVSALPFPYAVLAWIGFNLVCAIGAIGLLARAVARAAHPWPLFPMGHGGGSGFVRPWRYWMLVPLLMVASMPFLQAFTHGQNTFKSLLILTGTVLLWRSGRLVLAGMVCGLLFYKPQLASIVAAVLVLSSGWRALAGLAVTGTALLVTQELSMPGSTQLYLHQLPLNLAVMQSENIYLWERHATLKGFWRLLLDGRGPGEMSTAALTAWGASAGVLALGLIAATRNTWRTTADDAFGGHTRAIQRDRLIAAAIVSMPLLMPFYFDYDLLLLAVPFTLLAIERLRRPGEPMHPHDRLIVKLAAGLYLWLMINPGLAKDSGVNLTVLTIAAIAGLFIARACRETASVSTVEAEPLPAAVPPTAPRRALRNPGEGLPERRAA